MPSSANSSRRPLRAAGIFLAVLAIAVPAAGCGPGAAASPAGAITPSPTVTAPTVSGAWVRPPLNMDDAAAGYMVITGGSQADALTGASSPIAGSVQLHETSTDASGMTGMHEIDRLEVPAGATVKIQPGGYHLMFMNVTGTIAVGGTVQIDLTFEKAGKVTVQAEVRQG